MGPRRLSSPLIKEIVEKIDRQRQRTDVEDVLRERLGALPDSARASLQGLTHEAKLRSLLLFASVCPTLEAFLERLAKETNPAPPPVSTRRSRKRGAIRREPMSRGAISAKRRFTSGASSSSCCRTSRRRSDCLR